MTRTLEAPDAEVERASAIVRDVMERPPFPDGIRALTVRSWSRSAWARAGARRSSTSTATATSQLELDLDALRVAPR